jgi:glycosyltransferase involved in cell wall biosynthesis
MIVSLLTLGPPEQLSGGYLYHRRIAELANQYDARVEFVSVRPWPDPFSVATGDVLLVDSIAASVVAPWAWWGTRRRPLAAILHQPPGGIDHAAPRRAVQAALDRSLYRRCRLLIAASEALRDEMVARPHRLPAARIRVVPPGCDVAPPVTGNVRDLRHGRRVAFVSIGNWMARKGTLDLLNAFAQLAEDRATLHLAGRDDVEPRYGALVRARLAATDLAGRVVDHGVISRDEIARLYAGADAFVLASYREPYGTVYGEALAAGLPVVGWRAGNLPHLARDDVEGVVVAPGDIAGLSAALDRLATDIAWRNRLAAGAARRGGSLPLWSDAASALFGALSELVASAR